MSPHLSQLPSWRSLFQLGVPLVTLTVIGVAAAPAQAGYVVIDQGGVAIGIGARPPVVTTTPYPYPYPFPGTPVTPVAPPFYSTATGSASLMNPVMHVTSPFSTGPLNVPVPHAVPGAIVNSTLINPTIVNSPIYNSTLINPTIIQRPSYPGTFVQRSRSVQVWTTPGY